jgi:hypothetical protein
MPNTLAYLARAEVKEEKSFITMELKLKTLNENGGHLCQDNFSKKIQMNLNRNLFFSSKLKSYFSLLMMFLQSKLVSIRKGVRGTNTLAYYENL